jgi:hypothetical protein
VSRAAVPEAALQIEGRTSFLKKRSKKLLFPWMRMFEQAHFKEQKFFGSFFQKRTACLPLGHLVPTDDWPRGRATCYAAKPPPEAPPRTAPSRGVEGTHIPRADPLTPL